MRFNKRQIIILFSVIIGTALLAGGILLAGDSNRTLKLFKGHSKVLRVSDIERVSAGDDKIVDYVTLSSNELMVIGKDAGKTELFIWDAFGRRAYFIDVRFDVYETSAQLNSKLRSAFGNRVQAECNGKAIFLRGALPNDELIKKAEEIAKAFVDRENNEKIVNLIKEQAGAEYIQEKIASSYNIENLKVRETYDKVIVEGKARNKVDFDNVTKLVQAYTKKTVVNLIDVLDGKKAFSLKDEIYEAIGYKNVKISIIYQGGAVNSPEMGEEGEAIKDFTLVLEGEVENETEKLRAEDIAKAYHKNIINHIVLKAPQQVLIEAYVVEINKDDVKDIGISWGSFAGGYGGASNPSLGLMTFAENSGNDLRGDVIYQGAKVSDKWTLMDIENFNRVDPLSARISVLESNKKIKILSSPKLCVLSGEQANMKIGGSTPVTTRDQNGNPTVNFKDYGIQLDVKPLVDRLNNIKLEISTVRSSLDPSNLVGENPGYLEARTQTTVYVKDLETLVISGMVQLNHNNIENGIPYLKDIPLLGRLFKNKQKSAVEKELLIFLRPQIVRTNQKSFANVQLNNEAIHKERLETFEAIDATGRQFSNYNNPIVNDNKNNDSQADIKPVKNRSEFVSIEEKPSTHQLSFSEKIRLLKEKNGISTNTSKIVSKAPVIETKDISAVSKNIPEKTIEEAKVNFRSGSRIDNGTIEKFKMMREVLKKYESNISGSLN